MATYNSPPSLNTSHTTTTASNLPPSLDPSSLDTLPILTAILTRLQSNHSSSQTTNDTSSPHQSQPLTQSLSQSQTQPTSSPSFTTTQASGGFNSQDKFSTTPLTTKDIPIATDALKHRLQRARAQVAGLPDVERGLAEQEVEIRELEEKIKQQRAVLERLRELGERVGKEVNGADGEGKMEVDS